MREIFLAIMLLCFAPSIINSATFVTQDEFTWTFDGDYPTGQFANGDWWVAGSTVTITHITPEFTIDTDGKFRHGTMVNPNPFTGGVQTTGYGSANYHTYNPSLNIEESLPYAAHPGDSIVSALSFMTAELPIPGVNTSFKYMNVLTVVSQPPPEGSFRPPFSSSSEEILFNVSDIDWTKIPNLPPVSIMPELSTLNDRARRCWLDHTPKHLAQRINPEYGLDDYGAYRQQFIDMCFLRLMVNGTNEEKAPLLISMLQGGIDTYEIMKQNPHQWENDGGHSGGRKLPILFAGLVLGDADMLGIGAKTGAYLYENGYGPGNIPPDYIYFGEDMQTHYVSQLDVDITNQVHPTIPWVPSGVKPADDVCWDDDGERTNCGTETYPLYIGLHGAPYDMSDIGLPEYGIRHATLPGWNSKTWEVYKNYRGYPDRSWPITALVVRMMGLEDEWNHAPFFDYADRRVEVTNTKHGVWPPIEFEIQMYDTYRANYPIVWSYANFEGGTAEPTLPGLARRLNFGGPVKVVPAN